MSKSKKQGAALDLYIMSRCSDLLMQVDPPRRRVIVEWLATSIVNQAKPTEPPPPDPRHENIPFGDTRNETLPSEAFGT